MTNRFLTFALAAVALAPLVALGCSAADPSTECHPADPSCNHVGTGDDSGSSTGDDGGSQAQGDSTSPTSNDSGGGVAHDSGIPGSGDGGGPHDSGTALPPEGGAGGFAAMCDPQNNQCAAAYPVCFTFNARGPHCTKQCQGAGDCPAQSGGCSGMGVCKIP